MPRRSDRRSLSQALARASVAALGMLALASCAGTQASRPRRTSEPAVVANAAGPGTATLSTGRAPGAATPEGRQVLVFKRSIGVDPLASYFTLYANGQGIGAVVYGGRDGARVHRFVLRTGELRRVERLLKRTRLQNAPVENPGRYIYWVITGSGAHRLQEGAVPRSARPLLGALNAIADANHLY